MQIAHTNGKKSDENKKVQLNINSDTIWFYFYVFRLLKHLVNHSAVYISRCKTVKRIYGSLFDSKPDIFFQFVKTVKWIDSVAKI